MAECAIIQNHILDSNISKYSETKEVKSEMAKFLTKFIKNSSLALMSLIFTSLAILGGFYFYTAISLPDVKQLKDFSMQIPLRIYTSDGKLISEFGEKKRIPQPLENIPQTLVNAILDTEDQRFFEHRGVDFLGLMRAGLSFIATGKKSQGASTITMQVARNFFLNREKTFSRKINEILLAFKIDKNFNKKDILELYLNKIYFGNRAYGVAAAAQIYYGKSLSELTIAEMAMIAGLPQAPSRDNPIVNPRAARERRNHVLERMLENGHISKKEHRIATNTPIDTSFHETPVQIPAPYVAEMVRNVIVNYYGDKSYEVGFSVYTTIDSRLQLAANRSLAMGLLAYDQRHGYRGPEGRLATAAKNYGQHKLKNIPQIGNLLAAMVIDTDTKGMRVMLASGEIITLGNTNFSWANHNFITGDIIRIYKTENDQWHLGQIPQADCALVAMDPKNGTILALNGGFSYGNSNFNRVTQAERQTGSAFKPFIYAAALEKGLTLATIINDAPVVLFDHATNNLWRPQNSSKIFYGPTTLRTALTQSRNLASIRLLQQIGIDYAVKYLKNFGFSGPREAPSTPTLVLGAGSTTPLKMTQGYAVFANGGYAITPYIINKITISQRNRDRERLIFQADPKTTNNTSPGTATAPRVIAATTAYLISDALKSVIDQGTGKRAKILGRDDLSGKTGSTNDLVDGWFVGYNGDLVATVWLGFDHPQTTHEYGAKSALPIWIKFMKTALADKPNHMMKRPEEIVTVKIDPTTGFLANTEQNNATFEIFSQETAPTVLSPNDGSSMDQNIESSEQKEEPLF